MKANRYMAAIVGAALAISFDRPVRAVVVREVQNLDAERVLNDELLTVVVEVARILACNGMTGCGS